MRIGMLLRGPFPPDIRVDKEAGALHGAGHDVRLLAAADPASREPAEETYGVVRVHRVPPAWGLARALNAAWFHLTYRDRRWSRAIRHFVEAHAVEVLHVHDLPLARSAIAAGRAHGIPVILDLHENYPAAIGLWRQDQSALRRWITASRRRWLAYEGWAVGRASCVVVVVDEAKERLIAEHGVPADKVTIVMNVETEPDAPTPAGPVEGFTALYAGGGGAHRGLATAIRALSQLGDLRPAPRLIIVGPPEAERLALAALAQQLGVASRVDLVSWQPLDAVRTRVARSDVCLVPHDRNAHTDATIPHKLFQYMGAGKPVVVSDCRPLARILEETRAGLVFRSGDAADLARQLRRLHESPALRHDLGAHGAAAVRERYNWARESQALIRLYEHLRG